MIGPDTGIVCVACRCFMRVECNGVRVCTMMNADEPYQLWEADLYKCPKCGDTIVCGFAREPYAEHYQPDFARRRQQAVRGDVGNITGHQVPYFEVL